MMKRKSFPIITIYVPTRRRPMLDAKGTSAGREHATGRSSNTDPFAAWRRSIRIGRRSTTAGGLQSLGWDHHRWLSGGCTKTL